MTGAAASALTARDLWASDPARAAGLVTFNALSALILTGPDRLGAAARIAADLEGPSAAARLPTTTELANAYARLRVNVPHLDEPDSGAIPPDTDVPTGARPRPDSAAVGARREIRVAQLTGGSIPSGRPGTVGLEIVRKNVGRTDVDVIGNDGSYIAVGGSAKAKDLANLGRRLGILRWGAGRAGVQAYGYFEEGTPETVLKVARKGFGRRPRDCVREAVVICRMALFIGTCAGGTPRRSGPYCRGWSTMAYRCHILPPVS